MTRTQKSTRARSGSRNDKEPLEKPARLAQFLILFAAALAIALAAQSAAAKTPELPYTTIDHPQFTPASQAAFLSPHDLVIGVTNGKTAKAYPAAILAQHGVVQDRMPDGPIAVTW